MPQRMEKWHWDAILRYSAITVLMLVLLLAVCPFLKAFSTEAGSWIVAFQFYAALAALILSGLLMLLLKVLSRHPHYDFFMVAVAGMIAGVLSLT